MRFRKKPIVVEAYQITRHLLEDCLFNDKPYPEGLHLASASFHKERKEINSWKGIVITIHSQQTYVVEGDWIITEPDGIHFYPCKPDIFEATFERTFDDDPPLPGYRMGEIKVWTPLNVIIKELVECLREAGESMYEETGKPIDPRWDAAIKKANEAI